MNVSGKHYRTIWVKEGNDRVAQIIDQRHLPHRFVVEDLKNSDEVACAIKEMHVRGAGLIGAYPNGVGFGNVSVRIPRSRRFIISGTATGKIAFLTGAHYTLVTDFDIESN